MPAAAWSIALLLLASCGDDGSGPDDADAGAADAATGPCATDEACDDGRFCNGVERCTPGTRDADERGCAPALEPPCAPAQTCVEAEARCVTTCDVARDADGDGHDAIACGGDDCDDADASRFPGNAEICDAEGHDDDCDPATLGEDADADGFVASRCCNLQPAGFLGCGEDCDDARPRVNPEAAEVCNGADDNCNATTDEGTEEVYYRDADGDGFGLVAESVRGCDVPTGYALHPGDCDDAVRAVSPGTSETCDGLDNNCDGRVDEEGLRTYYRDADGDLVGTSLDAIATTSCIPPAGYVPASGDCADGDPEIRPGILDACDGIDGNCSLAGRLAGGADPSEDADGDGHAPPTSGCDPTPALPKDDCDDGEARAFPGADEACDGIDGDCDGAVDELLDETGWCGAQAQCSAGACRVTRHVALRPDASPRVCAIIAGGGVTCGAIGGPMAAVPSIAGAVEIAHGDQFACVRLAGGVVRCWGSNDYGQLGNGTRVASTEPTEVVGIADAVEISAARNHACARRASGEVRCWGNGRDLVPVVVPIEGAVRIATDGVRVCARRIAGDVVCVQDGDVLRVPLTDAREVALGGAHRCVRRASGVVLCWGDNDQGQLGDGSTIDSLSPVTVEGLTGAIDVAAGAEHTCVRRAGDEVWCWGRNEEGALGDGTLRARVLTPVASALGPATELALATRHSCARRTTGEIGCLVRGGTVVTGAAQIAGGGDRGCARLTTGEVRCWGPDAVADGVDRTIATPVPGVTGAVDLVVEARWSCAALDTGRVTCWGEGYGTGPVVVAGIAGAIEVSRGPCAIERDAAGTARLRCWSPGTAPAEVTGLPGAPVEHDHGSAHHCARLASGDVWCWGSNSRCQSYDERDCWIDRYDCPYCSSTTPRDSGLNGVALVTGGQHTCVLRADGTVLCRGAANAAQFGFLGDPVHYPMPIPGATGVTALAAGPVATYAVIGGTVRAWGLSAPAPPTGIDDATQVAAGAAHVCVLRRTGEVVCSGAGQSFWRIAP